jgi:hypothetical protein
MTFIAMPSHIMAMMRFGSFSGAKHWVCSADGAATQQDPAAPHSSALSKQLELWVPPGLDRGFVRSVIYHVRDVQPYGIAGMGICCGCFVIIKVIIAAVV